MTKVAVFSRLRARPGARQRLIECLAPLVDAARDEPATERYVIHTSTTDPDVVWFYELYRDDDGLAVHRESAAVQQVVPQLADLLAEPPDISFATPLRGKGL
jgi:quinol monooxygenase YgiN